MIYAIISAMRQKIILSISNFYIQLDFYPTEWQFIRTRFKNKITTYFSGFVVNQNPNKIDYIIDFIERKDITVIENNNSTNYYAMIYEEMNKRKMISFYHISIFHFQLLLRLITQKLLMHNKGFLLHGSANQINGKVNIFIGNEGAGKSTVIKLLRFHHPAQADDNVIIKKENHSYFFYQTPFIEKEWWVKKNPSKYQINKIFFLRKARYTRIEKIEDKKYLLKRLVHHFWTDKKYYLMQVPYLFKFIDEFSGFYFLYFEKDKKNLLKAVSGN
ncbi:MAG: hypothetical protein AAB929_01630 [Patescibacteria group bacterium]